MHSISAQNHNSVCVLLSGGIDSAACVAFYLARKCHVRAVHIDYGQSAANEEDIASEAIARHFNIERMKLELRGTASKGPGMIYGRNAFLLLTALMESGMAATTYAIGIHSGTEYHDCSQSFLDSIQRTFDIYTDGVVRVGAPFVGWTKRQIWEFCIERTVPTQLTYSCEVGGNPPCGQCLSCRDMEVLRAA